MEVAIVVTADRWDQPVPATTVVVDEQGQPRPIGPLLPETEAEIRRTYRLALRTAHTGDAR
jgi:hypothetical protein